MMSKWSKCIKLLKYSYGVKMCFIIAGVIAVLAVLIFLESFLIGIEGFIYSGMMFFAIFAMIMQLKDNIVFSNMVISSGKRRFLEHHFINISTILCGILGYALESLMILLFVKEEMLPDGSSIAAALIASAMVIAITELFYAMANKYFVLGVTLLYAFLFVGIFGALAVAECVAKWVGYYNGIAFLLGLLIILAGGGLAVIIRLWLYKKPYSKLSASAGMRKAI